ncbi:S26 family signal peptidase [Haloarcula limicola]|nr:S26 family signal peptidase [Halomicroarcula limicola]
MTLRRGVELGLEAAMALFLVAMVAGQLLGQPVLLGYVTTGSMQPTLDPGDGFVAVPAAVAGPIEEGDVVTFRAEELHGGGLTTHRVVDETERGYVTRGDNNPFTDQDGDEPPVTDAQIVAVAWQPGGAVLSIPGVGLLVTGTQDAIAGVQQRLAVLTGSRSLLGTQGIAYLLVALSLGAYVADVALSDDRKRQRTRSRETGTDVRLVVAVFAAAVVLAATAAMVAPAGSTEFGIVSAESDAPGSRVIETGTSESVPYLLQNGGFVPVVTYFEPVTDGVDVRPRETRIPGRSTVNATLVLTAPPETGYYRQYLVEHRYLLILPQPAIRALYGVHPWLPIAAIDGVLGGSFYLLGTTLAGTGRVRTRSREAPSRFDRFLSRLR